MFSGFRPQHPYRQPISGPCNFVVKYCASKGP